MSLANLKLISWEVTDGALETLSSISPVGSSTGREGRRLAESLLNSPITWIAPSFGITIVYPLGRYGEDEAKAVYNTSQLRTGMDIIGAVYNFYQTPISIEELQRLIEDPEVSREIILEKPRYTYGDTLLGLIFFEGLEPTGLIGEYRLQLGS